MDKRYTVFVSSTYEDLKGHRDAVIQAIMRAGHIPLGMEAFGAANASQWSIITKTIDASDYYVLLIARRYGSINEETGLGFTEMEYDYAIQQGIPCLVFQLRDDASWPGGAATDTDAGAVAKLRAFKQKSSSNRMIDFWSEKSVLPFQVMTALGNAFSDDPRKGWVRSSETASVEVVEELARLSRENTELRSKIQDEKGYMGGQITKELIKTINSEAYQRVIFKYEDLGEMVTARAKVLDLFFLCAEFSRLEAATFTNLARLIEEHYFGDNRDIELMIENYVQYYSIFEELGLVDIGRDFFLLSQEGKNLYITLKSHGYTLETLSEMPKWEP